MNNKSIFDNFESYSRYDNFILYRHNGPFINSNIYYISISIGFYGTVCSNPTDINLDLNEYKNLGLEIINGEGYLIE